jgi:hypothetical protein
MYTHIYIYIYICVCNRRRELGPLAVSGTRMRNPVSPEGVRRIGFRRAGFSAPGGVCATVQGRLVYIQQLGW